MRNSKENLINRYLVCFVSKGILKIKKKENKEDKTWTSKREKRQSFASFHALVIDEAAQKISSKIRLFLSHP